MRGSAVRYVRTKDGHSIAFMVHGEGLPLVLLPIQFNHVQLAWEVGSIDVGAAAWLAALSSAFRLITYDARCQGLSTRGRPSADWVEGELEDLSAVVDALGLDRFVLMGVVGRTHTAVHYAVRHPERVHALVLQGPVISGANALNVHGATLAERDWEFFLQSQVPIGASRVSAESVRAYLSAAMTQADWLRTIMTFSASDIGGVLAKVSSPTLVTCHDSPYVREPDCIEVAASIPGARLVMLDPSHYPGGSPIATLEAMDAFLRDLPEAGGPAVAGRLSPREVEVLRLVAEGMTNREIAEALVISERTVINHLSNIFTKTGAENRAGAAAFAFRHGLV